MYNAVGIDVSKGKSTIAVLQPGGNVVRKPFDVKHSASGLKDLVGYISSVRSKIEEVTWYLGGGSNISIFSNEAYIMERNQNIVTNPSDGVNRTTTHTGKVGLMYPSDYGYATDLRICQSKLGAYSTGAHSYGCRVNDWLFNEKGQYVITPYVTYNYIVWRVDPSGYLGGGNGAYDALTVQPIFYLKSNVMFNSGSGTEADPYFIQ